MVILHRLRPHRRWLAGQAVVWGVGIVILRLAVVPAERCPPVDAGAVRSAIDGASAWLVRGLRPDGRFMYGYYRSRDEVSQDYNDTRHAGVLFALYRVGEIEAGDAGMRYVMANSVEHDDWTAFVRPGYDADAGGSALLVAALVHRRLVTGDGRYDDLMRRLGRFLVAQMRSDGSVLEWWRPATERRVPGLFGKFSTGETFYALALLNRVFPQEGWDRPARRVVDYLATRRDVAEGYATRQPDHWASYGLAELAPFGLTDTEVAYARRLAGYFGYEIRFASQHTGRPLNMFTESGADLGVVGEASSALWRAAGEDRRLADLRQDLGTRITCLTGITVQRQVSAEDPNPRARGAWFFHGYTQMDDQQHATGALLGAAEVLR
jgi:hypothetical protein